MRYACKYITVVLRILFLTAGGPSATICTSVLHIASSPLNRGVPADEEIAVFTVKGRGISTGKRNIYPGVRRGV